MRAKRPPTPAQFARRAMKHTLAAVRLTRRAAGADGDAEDLEKARKVLSAAYSMLNKARADREEPPRPREHAQTQEASP